MSPAEIARRLSTKPATPERVAKAQALAKRSGVEWVAVLAALDAAKKAESEADEPV